MNPVNERRQVESLKWNDYDYELVRIHKSSRREQSIRMTPAVCAKMQVDESEWKDRDGD